MKKQDFLSVPNPQPLNTSQAVRNALGERRIVDRKPVIKSATLRVGEGYSQGTYSCLILDESEGGALVDLGVVCSLPEQVILQIAGGSTYNALCRWTVGSKVGLEYVGEPVLSSEAAIEMLDLARHIRSQGLLSTVSTLRERKFFGQEDLRSAAEAAEAGFLRLEHLLRAAAQI